MVQHLQHGGKQDQLPVTCSMQIYILQGGKEEVMRRLAVFGGGLYGQVLVTVNRQLRSAPEKQTQTSPILATSTLRVCTQSIMYISLNNNEDNPGNFHRHRQMKALQPRHA